MLAWSLIDSWASCLFITVMLIRTTSHRVSTSTRYHFAFRASFYCTWLGLVKIALIDVCLHCSTVLLYYICMCMLYSCIRLYLGRRYTASKCFSLLQHLPRRPPDLTDITDIFDAADEALFCKILHHPNHLLFPCSLMKPTHHTTSGQGSIIGILLQKSTNYMTTTSFSACCTRTCIDWQFSTLIYVLYCISYYVPRVELRSVDS